MKASRRISLLASLFAVVLFATYFLSHKSQFKPLADINAWLLAIIAVGNIAGIFLNGLFTKFVLRPFQKQIPILESFYVSLISSVGNFFAPVGAGFGFRAIYLKKQHGLSYSNYISTLSGNYVIVFLVSSFFGLISLFMLKENNSQQYALLVGIFATLFLVSLTLTFIQIPKRVAEHVNNKYLRLFIHNLARVTAGWKHIVSHPKLMTQLISLTVINFLLTVGITFAIIKSLHFSIALAPLILFSVLGSLSLFINVTPANLGVKEAIYIFSSTVLGFSVDQILSIALIDRGIYFFVLAILWAISRKLSFTNPSTPSLSA